MKKISTYLFAISVGIVSLTSCTSDDNATTEVIVQNELIGKWEMQKLDMKLVYNGEVVIDEKDIPTNQLGMVIQYNFKTDNTVDYYLFTPANAQQQATELSGTGTYSRTNESLTLTLNSSTTYTINLLNKDNLHLNLLDEETVNGIFSSLDMTQKFTKM